MARRRPPRATCSAVTSVSSGCTPSPGPSVSGIRVARCCVCRATWPPDPRASCGLSRACVTVDACRCRSSTSPRSPLPPRGHEVRGEVTRMDTCSPCRRSSAVRPSAARSSPAPGARRSATAARRPASAEPPDANGAGAGSSDRAPAPRVREKKRGRGPPPMRPPPDVGVRPERTPRASNHRRSRGRPECPDGIPVDRDRSPPTSRARTAKTRVFSRRSAPRSDVARWAFAVESHPKGRWTPPIGSRGAAGTATTESDLRPRVSESSRSAPPRPAADRGGAGAGRSGRRQSSTAT